MKTLFNRKAKIRVSLQDRKGTREFERLVAKPTAKKNVYVIAIDAYRNVRVEVEL